MTSTGIRLHAPAPGWSIDADVVVVGSGVAGLTAALRCEAAGLRTVVVTKARLDDGSTRWAQGGIAAARLVLDDAARLDPPLVLDYLALVDPSDFTDVDEDFTGEAVLAVAARVGTTRLIDNIPLAFGTLGAAS